MMHDQTSKFTINGEIQIKQLISIGPNNQKMSLSALPPLLSITFDGGTDVHISTRLDEQQKGIERRSVQVNIIADSIDQAHEKAFAALEWITDYTAFMLQLPVFWETHQMIDHSSKRRQVGSLPSMLNPKWFSFQDLKPPKVVPIETISPPREVSDKCLAALRWYHKGLAANYDIDRFIAFWVALELLAPESPQKPKAFMRPLNCDCGSITECPMCGVSTEYEPKGNGPMISAFLKNECGYSAEDTIQITQFRQFLHGAGRLTFDHMRHVGRMVELVRNATREGIKRKLAVASDDAPHPSQGLQILSTLSPFKYRF
jgi:hypothetical protein